MTEVLNVFESVQKLQDNPFPELWVEAMSKAGATVRDLDVDLMQVSRGGWVHLQWPEWFLDDDSGPTIGLLRLLRKMMVAKRADHRILLTIHNERAHSGRHPKHERVMWQVLLRLCTHIHLFTEAGAKQFYGQNPSARSREMVVIPHGNYAPVLGPLPVQSTSRDELGIPRQKTVVCTFGKLKAYKGAEELLATFLRNGKPTHHLVIAGKPDDDETTKALARATTSPVVTVMLRFLTQHELTSVIAAADLVVLPYRQVTNSGSALMALSVGRPVLMPRSPAFEELQGNVGVEWVHLYDGTLEWQRVEQAVSESNPDNRPNLAWCDWDVIAEQLSTLLWSR